MARYNDYNDGQHYFEIIDLEKDLPPDNRARIIKEVISSLDISEFDQNYNNDKAGAKAKHVRMMLGIILLGYVRKITGSRSIAAQFDNDLEFKYILSGNTGPDDSTIRDFRRRHVQELGKIFSMTVHLGSSLGMNDFGSLAIDGTKIQAYASLYETKNKKELAKSINLLSKQMGKTIERLNSAETEEEVDEFKKRLGNIEKRQTVLEDFQKLLEDKEDDEKVNRVDPDARLMKKSDKKSIIGYNAQAAVDCGEHGLIVSAEISQEATDDHLLKAIADNAEEETGKKYGTILADSGYVTYESMATATNDNRNLLGPDRLYEKDLYEAKKKGTYSKSQFIYDNENDCYYCPAGKVLEFKNMIKGPPSDLIFVYENKVVCAGCPKASLCVGNNGTYRRIHRDYRLCETFSSC
jgi:transposase